MFKRTELPVASHWGVTIRNQLLTRPDAKGLAVFFPGNAYPGEGPLLYYLRLAAQEAGFNCLNINYGFYGAGADITHALFGTVISESLEALSKAKQIPDIIIAKSMGTIIGGEICNRQNWSPRCFWLTPVTATLPYIERLGGEVVYGTADNLFPPEAAAELEKMEGVKITAIEKANHSLDIPGDWRTSLDILHKITETGVSFLKQV
ncbi:MAG TPA: hypothetical protein GX697_05205 [Firmicutes bacterium]|nr:hypothetical protein [Bacillota bacterium]